MLELRSKSAKLSSCQDLVISHREKAIWRTPISSDMALAEKRATVAPPDAAHLPDSSCLDSSRPLQSGPPSLSNIA